MKPEWIKYTASDKQIDEMTNAKNGWIVKYENGTQSQIEYGEPKDMKCPTHYLICQRHPLAYMINIWRQTGQPIWIKVPWSIPVDFEYTKRINGYSIFETTTPDWNLYGYVEYRLTEFIEE